MSLTLLAIHTATSENSSRLLSLRGSRSQDLTTRPLRVPQYPISLQQPGQGMRNSEPSSPIEEGVNVGKPRERREEASGEEGKCGVLDNGPEVEPLRGNHGM